MLPHKNTGGGGARDTGICREAIMIMNTESAMSKEEVSDTELVYASEVCHQPRGSCQPSRMQIKRGGETDPEEEVY